MSIFPSLFPKRTPDMSDEQYHEIVMAEHRRRKKEQEFWEAHRLSKEQKQELFEQRVSFWRMVREGKIEPPRYDSLTENEVTEKPVENNLKPITVIIKQYLPLTKPVEERISSEGLSL